MSGQRPAHVGPSRCLSQHAYAAGGHHELARLIAELGDLLAEPQPPGTPLLFPLLARPGGAGQDIADPDRPVIDEVLLRVQPPAPSVTSPASPPEPCHGAPGRGRSG